MSASFETFGFKSILAFHVVVFHRESTRERLTLNATISQFHPFLPLHFSISSFLTSSTGTCEAAVPLNHLTPPPFIHVCEASLEWLRYLKWFHPEWSFLHWQCDSLSYSSFSCFAPFIFIWLCSDSLILSLCSQICQWWSMRGHFSLPMKSTNEMKP